MTDKTAYSPRYRLLRYLVAGYIFFIIYASLSPFSGWQEQGLYFIDTIKAPLKRTFTWFDAALNCLAYVPLGFMLAYMMRYRWRVSFVIFAATLTGLLLSACLEFAQLYLPSRVSSSSDVLSNITGTFFGALLALFLTKYTWFERVERWQDKWLHRGKFSDSGLALLALWIFAQTNPSLPMLGSVFIGVAARWPFDIVHPVPFNWQEYAGVALNLVLLGILLSSLLRDRRHTIIAILLVLSVVTLIKFIAAAIFLKSWALLLWMNSEAMFGVLSGWFLLLLAIRLPRSWLTGIGAVAAVTYFVLVQNLIFGTPTSAVMRLFHWHYVHMLNYNGLSKFVILLFPVLLLGYLIRTSLIRK